MIEIGVGADDVAEIRLTTDAVWETTASLNVLMRPRQHALHARLFDRLPVEPRFDLDLLRELTADATWTPDTLGPAPLPRPPHPREQFDAIRGTDPDIVRRDLATLRRLAPRSRAAAMSGTEFVAAVSSAMAGYWRDVLEPIWDRVDAIAAADIAHQSTVIASSGLGTAMARLNDRLTYSDGTIRVTMAASGAGIKITAAGRGVWFVPSVFGWPWIAVAPSGPAPVISYAARGAGRVWTPEPGRTADLAALLGRSRAAILVDLDIPRTTTGLATRLRLTPGTVSDHLSVLTASGLLTARREGRQVLYSRTPMADQFLSSDAALLH